MNNLKCLVAALAIAASHAVLAQETPEAQKPQEAMTPREAEKPQEVQEPQQAKKEPNRLSLEEIKALVPGAKIEIIFEDNSTFRFRDADGGVIKELVWRPSDDKPNEYTVFSAGNWWIKEDSQENGRYCGKIGWKIYGKPTILFWCRKVFRSPDGLYILQSVTGYPPWKMRVSK